MTQRSLVSFASVALTAVGLVASIGAHAANLSPTSLLGDTVPVDVALRTINIAPGTKYINVDKGETIRFVSGGKEFAVAFDSLNTASFDLERLAPQGSLDHPVTVYMNEGPSDFYVR